MEQNCYEKIMQEPSYFGEIDNKLAMEVLKSAPSSSFLLRHHEKDILLSFLEKNKLIDLVLQPTDIEEVFSYFF